MSCLSDLYSRLLLASSCDIENVYGCFVFMYQFNFLDINNMVCGLFNFVFLIDNQVASMTTYSSIVL